MKKTRTTVIFFLVLINFLVSIFSFAYTPSSNDKVIVEVVIQRIQKLKQEKPSTISKLIKIIPIVQQKLKKKGNLKMAYIFGEIYKYLQGSNLQILNNSSSSSSYLNKISFQGNLPQTFLSSRKKTDFQNIYEVGPGKQYFNLNQVPREDLKPSTLILIYYKPSPYKNKFVINVPGTEQEPVVILGVPNKNGELPKIDGNLATTRKNLDYRNEKRSLIKIGGSSNPSNKQASWIYIENLELYGAKLGNFFTNDSGKLKKYSDNASCVHIEYGSNIYIRNSILRNCSNGLFTNHYTQNIFIQGNKIYHNGNPYEYYTHNTYTESKNIVYEYNFMGSLYPNAIGNNLKDRSAGTIIRYNWIEGGNRQIDLVETGRPEIKGLSTYNKTFVYGNVLFEKGNDGNQQIMHYGGDGGNKKMYRKGNLYFYNNTVISNRTNYTTLINISTNDAKFEAFNNIFYTSAGPRNFAITDGRGKVKLQNNIIPPQRKKTHNSIFEGTITEYNNIITQDPGFQDITQRDFSLTDTSIALGKTRTIPLSLKKIQKQYKLHQQGTTRGYLNTLGAFEHTSKQYH